MTLYDTFSILIVLSALFAYINYRFVKLPSAIGLMLIALLTSVGLIVLGIISPPLVVSIANEVKRFDFSQLLLNSMLSFMLFAGAIHIRLVELRKERLSIILFSTLSVVISTFLIGSVLYYLLPLFGLGMSFLSCLLFGALISPTDPIAVLGILKEANIAKSLEMKIAGESLFNDGVAVVVFLTILHTVQQPVTPNGLDVTLLFLREAGGGILWGLMVGYVGFLLMRSIDNYKVEVLISLAVVMGGYAVASMLHISGPLAMVAAGILVGNQGKEFAMSETTREYIDKFWELIDESLNAILFVLIGLELLIIHVESSYYAIAAIAIIVVLLARYSSVWVPAQLIRWKESINQKTLLVLTWGGLRGGISIALALSLPVDAGKDLWVALTYSIVAFSIVVQGLTIGKLARVKG